MGISAIDDVVDSVSGDAFKNSLKECKFRHEHLRDEIDLLLEKYHDEGKDPGFMARSMVRVKTNAKIAMDSSDETVADLVTDGCYMAIKNLQRYLNQYASADETSKTLPNG